MKIFKRLLFGLIALSSITYSVMWFANKSVLEASENKTYSIIATVPARRVGLLLGTSKFLKGGYLNSYFANRIDAATALFRANKIKYIIISGDNSRKNYDEPSDMRNELIKNGIDSTRIFLDYAGFRTFDSMVRLKKVFGQDTVTVISQKFHNERALYIANELDINAIGFNAKDVSMKYGFKTNIREKFARVKVILDFIVGVEPKFLGDKIEIR